ncbi:MAG: hypothetical protein ACLFM0_03840 [Spirochaetales bacterium]
MSAQSDSELDPEVAELLPVDFNEDDNTPDFEDLFGESSGKNSSGSSEKPFDNEGFVVPDEIETEPHAYFNDKRYYKLVLTDEGEIAKRIHELLRNFLKAEDAQDRSHYRSKLGPAVWDLCGQIASRTGSSLPVQKRLFQRFRLLLPTMVSAEQRSVLARVIQKNETGEPVHYVDEWLEQVAHGMVNQSATDETKTRGKSSGQRISAEIEKARGRYEAQLALCRSKIGEITGEEARLKERVGQLCSHEHRHDFEDLILPYSEQDRSAISDINQTLRRLSNMNRELARAYREFDGIMEELEKLKSKEPDGQDGADRGPADAQAATTEMGTVRQMAKMCVGRQGNHFPLLLKQYFRASIREIGSRENVIRILAEVERLDPGLFLRTFKQQTNRIVPNVILVPCYGDNGVCWEPFERYNKATSRGRLAVPMYPKDLRTAVISACGDLRWQIAKEKAAHYWMEEGLTGWYYQWFTENRLKGDVKDRFIEDYVLWITRESEGTQKLERDVRSIFWRYIPFPQDVKELLKNRGFVYQDLYKKDQNRSVSDGY